MSSSLPEPCDPGVDCSGNPYSAIALYGVHEVGRAHRRDHAPSYVPWWMSPLAIIAIAAVHLYRSLVPTSARRRCIYTPTCSSFGLQAIKRYGALQGTVATIQRIRRCNGALYCGGDDPP